MDDFSVLIAALVNGGFATLVLEYVGKPLLRFVIPYLNTWFKWNLSTEFSANFYKVIVSGLNVALIPVMSWMGWVEPILSWEDFAKRLLLALVATLFSFGAYNETIGKMKANIAYRDATQLVAVLESTEPVERG